MIEYGALISSSFASQLGSAWRAFANTISVVPLSWYIGGLVVLALVFRFLIKK
jgi:hypothetical protein